jgi:DNA-binding MarR family transcriptional regulator
LSRPIKRDEHRLKVYALLVEGKAQTTIAGLLKLNEVQVCRIAKDLEAGGFIRAIRGTKRPKLYEKGPNGNELDALLISQKPEVYARGVTEISKNYARVETAKVHHLKYRAKVLKVGDTQFLRQYFNRRNVQRFKGQIPYYSDFVSVEYEVTPNQQNFYVYPPEMDLTEAELGDYEVKASAVCQDILNGISKKAGWKFGLPEKTEWETHIAVENAALVGGIAGKYNMKSGDGTAFLSNSNGRDELEFKSQGGNADRAIRQAKIMLELPGQVIEISTKLSELESTLEQLVRILTLQTTGLEKVAEINGLLVQLEAKDALSRVQVANSTEAARASMESRPDIGGMYQ